MRGDTHRIHPNRAVGRATPGPKLDTSASGHADNRASYVIAARELAHFDLGGDRVDVRNWPVFAADGLLVGAVDRLMVEPSSQRVRYLAVSILADADRETHPAILGSALVPVGMARRLDEREVIMIDALTSAQLEAAPRLSKRTVMRADEDAALAAYGLPNSCEIPAADFYKRPQFDERSLSANE
jgi:hypothetical protein